MKQYLSLLAACLLAGCSAGPQATESVPQTLRSSYQCDVPQAQTFPRYRRRRIWWSICAISLNMPRRETSLPVNG
ncbi:hypothetical protein O0544_19355 [Edwardsiella anguillarum]|nr:hypothetical protein [Edwardsiella anguillarum]